MNWWFDITGLDGWWSVIICLTGKKLSLEMWIEEDKMDYERSEGVISGTRVRPSTWNLYCCPVPLLLLFKTFAIFSEYHLSKRNSTGLSEARFCEVLRNMSRCSLRSKVRMRCWGRRKSMSGEIVQISWSNRRLLENWLTWYLPVAIHLFLNILHITLFHRHEPREWESVGKIIVLFSTLTSHIHRWCGVDKRLLTDVYRFIFNHSP